MEIKLNQSGTEAGIADMTEKAWKAVISETETEIGGQSEALEEMLDACRKFSALLLDYHRVLNSDIQTVSEAVRALAEADREESGHIRGLGEFFHQKQTP